LNHSLPLSTYYFFPICYTTPNFKHTANLIWRMNPKSNNHFGYFFIPLWPCEVLLPRFLQGPKNDFCHFKCYILQSTRWKFLNFFHIFSNQFTIRSYGYICPKMLNFFLGSCTRNDNFRVVWGWLQEWLNAFCHTLVSDLFSGHNFCVLASNDSKFIGKLLIIIIYLY